MDRPLGDALERLLAQVEPELARYERAAAPPVPAAAQPAGTQVTLATAGTQNPAPGALPAASAPPGSAPPAVRTPGPPTDPQTPAIIDAAARRRFASVSVGATAFVATGKASDYFKLGYGSSVHLGLAIPAGPGSFGVGLHSGVTYFQADGAATSVEGFLVPLGAEVRYTLDQGLPIGVFVRLCGGPALLGIRSDYWGDLSKVLPYALAGLGVTAPFGRRLGASLDLSYGAYFEGSLLIMAFSPSLSLYVRL